MGLDATAFERVELFLARSHEDLTEEDFDHYYSMGYTIPYFNPDFPGREDRLVEGVYETYGGVYSCGCSYGTFSTVRRLVSRVALGVDAVTIWSNPEPFKKGTLFEWINFADNEGTLGPDTCLKLAEDCELLPDPLDLGDEWYTGIFAAWRKMFRLAAGGGMIVYR